MTAPTPPVECADCGVAIPPDQPDGLCVDCAVLRALETAAEQGD